MSDKPAYSCGALDCCEGDQYPACQLPPIKGATITLHIAGDINVTHYDETAGGQDVCPCTD